MNQQSISRTEHPPLKIWDKYENLKNISPALPFLFPHCLFQWKIYISSKAGVVPLLDGLFVPRDSKIRKEIRSGRYGREDMGFSWQKSKNVWLSTWDIFNWSSSLSNETSTSSLKKMPGFEDLNNIERPLWDPMLPPKLWKSKHP